ncbi:MAG: M16 family metallopeptidase [Bacteroidales bacterium]
MNKSKILCLLLAATLAACSGNKYQKKNVKDSNGYSYESISNDPADLRIYTLDNGLKVYLSPNHNEPRVMGVIGVRAGSTSEPLETTGLAHYMEHIMFKGTSSFGTTNWEKEKPLLDSISNLFEVYRNETDEAKRKAIYANIDKLSVEASTYAIPNEYDKMTSEIGARYTNAFTSYDRTAYINDVPSSELKKWINLEYNRFGDIALRLFHTELETVYEEFNMYQDRDEMRADVALQSSLFPTNPLGHDVIGYPSHLKNPSMVNILKFKDTWYVPNNMVICLSGDFNSEQVIKMIDETFGKMQSKPLPTIDKIAEKPIEKPIEKEVFGPDAESLSMAYRCDNNTPEDRKMFYLLGRILYNGTAGLIDIDLLQDQKVLEAYAYSNFINDYGTLTIYAKPKNDQTLEQVKDEILMEIDKLKKGDFPDWMPTAIANQSRLSSLRGLEQNWRVYSYLNAFIQKRDWSDILSFPDEVEKVTKQQIVDYANKLLGNNYVAVYKRRGEAKDLVKVNKPKITPITINRTDRSKFYEDWLKIPADSVKPEFIDYANAFESIPVKEGIDLSYIQNKKSELFTNYYIVDFGKNHNIKAPIAINYLPYIGTKKHSAADLKRELFRYGLSTYVYSGNRRSWVYISGLNRNHEKGLELMEEILNESEPDTAAFRKYAERVIKDRNDAKLNQDRILWDGMWNYAVYGAKSPFNDIVTNDELRNINPKELTDLAQTLTSYPHKVLYCGPSNKDNVKDAILKYHKTPETLTEIPAEKDYPELDTKGKQVLLVDYDMSQVNLILLSKGVPFSEDVYVKSNLFNQYFGNSMSSIVFQEIREAQGMSYSAWLGYNSPSKKDNSFYLTGFIGTQPDKLDGASATIERLLNNMVENDKSLEISRKAIINTIASERIQNEQLFFSWLRYKDLGINHDIRKDLYEAAKNGTMDDLKAFFDGYIKSKPYTYLIIGNTKAIDKKILNKMGEVKMVNLEELFGY